ncbi:MAG: hypothetical protein NZT92_11420 [Abditibacteriales bacterium]|nr:hypothetical protein [Abditibacteriales bacterium]MDW8366558.1 hypothetical protein [Abditibacteriales bacterium]
MAVVSKSVAVLVGQCYEELGQYEKAIEQYKKILPPPEENGKIWVPFYWLAKQVGIQWWEVREGKIYVAPQSLSARGSSTAPTLTSPSTKK